MNQTRPSIAYLTAGAGGMICGSCMHDNTLVRALIRRGIDAHLIPTYTPIRTDEENVSRDRVFFGGINVFLSQKVPLYRHLPSFATRLLDQPWLIRLATKRASAVRAEALGDLTVSMLRGTHGYQNREVEELCTWLATDLKPDLIVLSNILIAGCVPRLKQLLRAPVLVTLQGDDIFLESLSEQYREIALAEIQRLVGEIDGFIANSRYYADFMSSYLRIPGDKIHVVPLGLDVTDYPKPESIAQSEVTRKEHATIGYLARMAPEKGLHLLVDAFIKLRQRTATKIRLRLAGWLGEQHREYVDEQKDKIRKAQLDADVDWVGEVDRREKLAFLQSLDVLSVPTVYREPKGLFVLEALAAAVPVVQPSHGAFPELLAATGGGQMFPPNDAHELSVALESLLNDEATRTSLGRSGQRVIHEQYNADAMAQAAWNVMREFLPESKRQAVDATCATD